MKEQVIVKPSSQIEALLPLWIRDPSAVAIDLARSNYINENHRNFVNFMTKSAESEERVGFSDDILQHLLDYRDFDTFQKQIIQYSHLAVNGDIGGGDVYENPLLDSDGTNILAARPQGAAKLIVSSRTNRINQKDLSLSAGEEDKLELMSGYGFPERNGVILIDDEVILYRRREGNILYELERGATGTSVLPTYKSPGTFLRTTAEAHLAGSVVVNLSVMFLVSMIDTIHRTYAHGIDSTRIVPELNRSSFLQNIKDFFRSKGSKLGIKALFKALFAENDVDVFYPGDRMITPSKSTYYKPLISRVVPIPEVFCNPEENYTTPENLIGASVTLKSYLDDKEYGKTFCEYSTLYFLEDQEQYELSLDKSSLEGDFIANPNTILTRPLSFQLSNIDVDDTRIDTATITVESTLGFPKKGIVFIDGEAITYQSKSPNQFLKCKRGHIGVVASHSKGSHVYGPYYLESRSSNQDGVEYVSRSWSLGLVESVEVKDSGLLHHMNDRVVAGDPGNLDARETALCYINEYESVIYTFQENYNDTLIRQNRNLKPSVGNRTYGVNGVYYDDDNIFVSSSGVPEYIVGNGAKFGDIGDNFTVSDYIAVIPKRTNIQPNNAFEDKGNETIGIFVDGVRAYSNVSPDIVKQGQISQVKILDAGSGYKNPSVVVSPALQEAVAVTNPVSGAIESVKLVTQPTESFTSQPQIRITAGEGAKFNFGFDNYGRLDYAIVTDGGKYYTDTPVMKVIDTSQRGKGALISANVRDGSIISIKIINPGIDYNKNTTTIVAEPVGSGAELYAQVEYYQKDRYNIIKFNPELEFDIGNGFVYSDVPGSLRTTWGYTANPKWLRSNMGDEGKNHSPIIGWAYDGNPIYGPYGYINTTDVSEGVERMVSGYVLREDRFTVVPAESEGIGFDPPALSQYPLGTFVEDYYFAPSIVNQNPTEGKYIATNDGTLTLTDDIQKLIEIELSDDLKFPIASKILDENNGRVCNTPEFPKELYPDGVYCYFVTVEEDGITPAFPYIIGNNFNNRPISQMFDEVITEEITPRNNSYSPRYVDDVILKFDYEKAQRLTHKYLNKTNHSVDIAISNLTKGSIDGVLIDEDICNLTRNGDLVFFDEFRTGGGGAQAVVSSVKGSLVSKASSAEVNTSLISKNVVVELQNNLNPDGSFAPLTFVKDTAFYSFGVGGTTRGKVNEFNQGSKELKVQCEEGLVQKGDKIYDNKRRLCEAGTVVSLAESKKQSKLYLDSLEFIEVGDKLSIQDEVVEVKLIGPDYVEVIRGENPKELANESDVSIIGKYLYTIETNSSSGVLIGDMITIEGSEFEEVNGNHQVVVGSYGTNSFSFFVSQEYPNEPNVKYSSDGENILGEPASIEVTSGGAGYETLPVSVGIYKRELDRAETKIHLDGTQISSVEVVSGGTRYVNPVAYVVDLQNSGSGALLSVSLSGESINSIDVVMGGFNYIEPVLYLVEVGRLISTTSNIGKITSLKVLNPGRRVSADKTLKPKLDIETNLIVRYVTNELNTVLIIDGGSSTDEFEESLDALNAVTGEELPSLLVENVDPVNEDVNFIEIGDKVYQGVLGVKYATADVIGYDSDRSMVMLDNIVGTIKENEVLYSERGAKAFVVREGQADCRVKVDGTSEPEGRFIDDTSMVSEAYPVIQDSYRYQWFSYVIASPIQKQEYDTFVQDIVHPAGFVRFADLTIHDSVDSTFNATEDPVIVFDMNSDPVPQ